MLSLRRHRHRSVVHIDPRTLALFIAAGCIVGTTILVHGVFTLRARKEAIDHTPSVHYPMQRALRTMHLGSPLHRYSRAMIAVIIENHAEARPRQLGLERALLVEEFIVEAGITRFAVLFDADDLPPTIGPVRSLRPYFVDALRPWTTFILHAGGSPEAYERAEAAEELTAINALVGRFGNAFERNNDLPAPHNLFTTNTAIEKLLEGRSIANVRWPPYHLGLVQSHSGAGIITINFFSKMHNVEYAYDHVRQRYLRRNGDVVSALHPQNVLVLEMPIAAVGEHGRLTIPVEGSGGLLLFRDGVVEQGTWHKAAAQETMRFFALDGSPLAFHTGPTWMTILPDLQRVTWE